MAGTEGSRENGSAIALAEPGQSLVGYGARIACDAAALKCAIKLQAGDCSIVGLEVDGSHAAGALTLVAGGLIQIEADPTLPSRLS